jgi:pimeloyl-ACP methyl ester carboxylesterase
MASDAVGLLDHLGIGAAHLFGTSMGGMICQTIAIEYPDRVITLTSAYATTGEQGFGMPQPNCLAALMGNMVPLDTREAKVQSSVDLSNLIGTVGAWDPAEIQRRCEELIDRAHNPAGTSRQAVAMFASGSRAEGLSKLRMPTLVLHGDSDPLVNSNGGERTAHLVPNARLRIIEGMAHDLPPSYWDVVMDEFRELL